MVEAKGPEAGERYKKAKYGQDDDEDDGRGASIDTRTITRLNSFVLSFSTNEKHVFPSLGQALS